MYSEYFSKLANKKRIGKLRIYRFNNFSIKFNDVTEPTYDTSRSKQTTIANTSGLNWENKHINMHCLNM